MKNYFAVKDCTREQLHELKCAIFWADDTDQNTLTGINHAADIPDWLVFQKYENCLFSNECFLCTNGSF